MFNIRQVSLETVTDNYYVSLYFLCITLGKLEVYMT